jgi:hypothetical protein
MLHFPHRKTNNLHLLEKLRRWSIHVKGQENWTSIGKVVTVSQQSSDNPRNEICKYYSKFKSWSEEVNNELLSLPLYSLSRWRY